MSGSPSKFSARAANMPKLIQQDNAKLKQKKKSLDEVFDNIMEKSRTERTNQVIELNIVQPFKATHAIVWLHLPQLKAYYSPSFSLTCPEEDSIISCAFQTISPIPITAQYKHFAFKKGIDDRIIPETHALLMIPILNKERDVVAVIQLARKPEKPFNENDFGLASWFMKKFKIYGSFLFPGSYIARASLELSFTGNYDKLINKLCEVLQTTFNARSAEIWMYKIIQDTTYRIESDGDDIIYNKSPAGAIDHSFHTYSIVSNPTVSACECYDSSIDGYFDESILIVPYMEKPTRMWAIALRGREGGFYQTHINELKSIIPFAVKSIRNARTSKKEPPEVDAYKQGLTALLDIAEALSGVLDLDKLIPMIMEKACLLLAAERCSLFLVDSQTGDLVSYFAGGLQNKLRLRIGRGIVGTTAQTGEVIRIDDAYSDNRFDRTVDMRTGFTTKSILSVPIYNNNGEISGVTEIFNKRDGCAFTDDDQRLMIGFNVFCGIALDNARLYSASIGLTRQVKSFIEMSQQLTKATSMRNIVESILNSAKNISEGRKACLYLLDANEKITPLVMVGDQKETPLVIIRTILEKKEVRIVDQAEAAEIMSNYSASKPAVPARLGAPAVVRRSMVGELPSNEACVCLFPLVSSEGVVLGVMEVDTNKRISSKDQKLLECFAVFAAASLERNQLKDIATLGKNETELKQWLARDERSMDNQIPTRMHIPSKQLSLIWTVNFDSTAWDGVGHFQVVFNIFHRFRLQEEFNISNEKLFRFLIELRDTYNPVPYHNWRHAVDVTQYTSYQIEW